VQYYLFFKYIGKNYTLISKTTTSLLGAELGLDLGGQIEKKKKKKKKKKWTKKKILKKIYR
jgi:hypothetical protein